VVLWAIAASSACAANFSAPPRPEAVAPYSWAGCYAGINAGGGYHSSSLLDLDGLAGNGGGIGAVSGGQAGCNYRIDRFIVGAEGEAYWSYLDTQISESGNSFGTETLNSKSKYDADIALRVGYAFDRLLAYTKVGLAVGGFDWSLAENDPTLSYSVNSTASQTLYGLLLGIGFEYALSDRVSAKVEYDYMNFGDPSISFSGSCVGAGCAALTGSNFTETSNEVLQMLKVGLNYKFSD
jgi:outer membrane immunogenic protein